MRDLKKDVFLAVEAVRAVALMKDPKKLREVIIADGEIRMDEAAAANIAEFSELRGREWPRVFRVRFLRGASRSRPKEDEFAGKRNAACGRRSAIKVLKSTRDRNQANSAHAMLWQRTSAAERNMILFLVGLRLRKSALLKRLFLVRNYIT